MIAATPTPITTAAAADGGRPGFLGLVTANTRNASTAVPTSSAVNAVTIPTARHACASVPKIAGLGKYSPNTMALSSLPGSPLNSPC